MNVYFGHQQSSKYNYYDEITKEWEGRKKKVVSVLLNNTQQNGKLKSCYVKLKLGSKGVVFFLLVFFFVLYNGETCSYLLGFFLKTFVVVSLL